VFPQNIWGNGIPHQLRAAGLNFEAFVAGYDDKMCFGLQ